jgi:hypothetical protein
MDTWRHAGRGEEAFEIRLESARSEAIEARVPNGTGVDA